MQSAINKRISTIVLISIINFYPINLAVGNEKFSELANKYYLNLNDEVISIKLKNCILDEAKKKAFTGPANSMKIRQYYAAQRGMAFLHIMRNRPSLFRNEEVKLVRKWIEELTKRAFKIEWSDFYYMLAFKMKMTGPYRNQEVGVGALAVFYEILKEYNPGLAQKAKNYVLQNAVTWRKNFRNTDDSIAYQAVWIYNAWNVGRYCIPKTLQNNYSKASFDWLLKQWPPNGLPLGYNPNGFTIVPDIFYLGAKLHNKGEYRWIADRTMEVIKKNKIKLRGNRPGFQFKDSGTPAVKPQIASEMIESPGGLTQRPSKIRPDKIVFRGGWENDSLYALMNLRYDGYHGYRATNCMITLHYGVPFVVEDIVKRKREWLPEGRKLVRDDDIERYRLNGFYIREPSLYRVINRMDIFRNRYFQTLPRHTKNNVFIKKENFDLSITEIVDWLGWDNKRICIRMGNDYIIVFDINKCKTPKEHNVIWHLKGEYDIAKKILRQNKFAMRVGFLYSKGGRILIKSSEEKAEPLEPKIKPDYDVKISWNTNKSVAVSYFVPLKSKKAAIVPINVDNELVFLKISYGEKTDVIFINNTKKPIKFKGMICQKKAIIIHNGKKYEM